MWNKQHEMQNLPLGYNHTDFVLLICIKIFPKIEALPFTCSHENYKKFLSLVNPAGLSFSLTAVIWEAGIIWKVGDIGIYFKP